MRIEEHKKLAPLTTIGLGGPARWYTCCSNEQDVIAALKWAQSNFQPLFILGGGSNSLIADEGFTGLVLHVKNGGCHWQDDGLVTAAAGEDWDHLVQQSIDKGFSGIECLSGIPGTVGSTPIQNVGAYGQEVQDTIVRVDAIDRVSMESRSFSNTECDFSYRMSRFKNQDRNRYVIVAVTFQLNPRNVATIRYGELLQKLEASTDWNSDKMANRDRLKLIREVVLATRSKKGMVIDSQDPDSRSLGSFFVNPIISDSDKDRVLAIVAADKIYPAPTLFPTTNGTWKISAAWLIEHSGTAKGERFGGAAVSTKHTLALINQTNATTRDILSLASKIKDRVAQKFAIPLVQEPELIS